MLLRPLVQDTLFPTVCYVAGPNELAYLAQLRGIYEAFGVPMPLMQQRGVGHAARLQRHAVADAPRAAARIAARPGRGGAERSCSRRSCRPPWSIALDEAGRTLAERMDALAEAVAQVDPTLEGAARSTLGRMQDDLKKLHGKIIQAAKRKDETLRRQFKHAQAQAFRAASRRNGRSGSCTS